MGDIFKSYYWNGFLFFVFLATKFFFNVNYIKPKRYFCIFPPSLILFIICEIDPPPKAKKKKVIC